MREKQLDVTQDFLNKLKKGQVDEKMDHQFQELLKGGKNEIKRLHDLPEANSQPKTETEPLSSQTPSKSS